MNIINASITVLLDAAQVRPLLVEWNGQTYSVMNVLDDWTVRSKRSGDEGPQRHMILSTDRHLMEVVRLEDRWILHRIHS